MRDSNRQLAASLGLRAEVERLFGEVEDIFTVVVPAPGGDGVIRRAAVEADNQIVVRVGPGHWVLALRCLEPNCAGGYRVLYKTRIKGRPVLPRDRLFQGIFQCDSCGAFLK